MRFFTTCGLRLAFSFQLLTRGVGARGRRGWGMGAEGRGGGEGGGGGAGRNEKRRKMSSVFVVFGNSVCGFWGAVVTSRMCALFAVIAPDQPVPGRVYMTSMREAC